MLKFCISDGERSELLLYPRSGSNFLKLGDIIKSYKQLYSHIIDFNNLYAAWRKARKNKRYKISTARFEQNLDVELLSLYRELTAQAYQPGDYAHFVVHEPKRRLISAAPFRDRVVHHALCNIIEPIYERKFIYDSYANRRGKGTHAALDRCTHYLRRYQYVLQCDVQQFFPAIDHAILKRILGRTLACPPTLALCEQIIDSGQGVLRDEYEMRWFPGDDLFAAGRPRGLPIGNLTSQFWANVYLNELDQFVKHTLRCKAYLRYVDDFLLFADDKATLHRWRAEIITFLQALRLTLHENRAQPRPVGQGVTFLGFVVFPTHRRLKRSKGIQYRRHLQTLFRYRQRGVVEQEQFQASLMAWIGHVQHGDTWGLRRQMLGELTV